jgi:hypothetical protein
VLNHFHTTPPEGITLEIDAALMASAASTLPMMPEDPDLADRWIHWLTFYNKTRRELLALHAGTGASAEADNVVPIRSA